MNKIAQIIVIIVWFFIIAGTIIITKMCVWGIDQKDIISVLVGTIVLLATWSTVGYELVKTVKKYFK